MYITYFFVIFNILQIMLNISDMENICILINSISENDEVAFI